MQVFEADLAKARAVLDRVEVRAAAVLLCTFLTFLTFIVSFAAMLVHWQAKFAKSKAEAEGLRVCGCYCVLLS